ncbi:hypothetical protein ACKKBG_A04255 [Auxenochlorella protothecoides x Auxenochlorella symbiontica]
MIRTHSSLHAHHNVHGAVLGPPNGRGARMRPSAPSGVRGAKRWRPCAALPEPTKGPRLAADHEGPSNQPSVILSRLKTLALPYWMESSEKVQARWKLARVLGLTLGTTGISVVFNYLGRDFFNALAAKDQAKFSEMLIKYLGAIVAGIPVFVFRDYYQSLLAVEWREWMTRRFTSDYLSGTSYYNLASSGTVDNPDQRISSDVRNFTDAALALNITLLSAVVDLVSFSGILYSIYPPLFLALLTYSVGGTGLSYLIGKRLVGLNFNQEAREADFRYGLVRVRENAESIAFYGGEESESRLLGNRLSGAISNLLELLKASRNLAFFTSFYRFLIQLLPAAVIAPLYFKGDIEFGVINQSTSAFNHILGDVSLVVYQFESLAGFSAIIDRLGQFREILEDDGGTAASLSSSKEAPALDKGNDSPGTAKLTNGVATISVVETDVGNTGGDTLLTVQDLTLIVPGGTSSNPLLISALDLTVRRRSSVLIMGPSGAGKTSLLRAVAGLWRSGSGTICCPARGSGLFFVPQRPYMVLGTLREQLLYPTWTTVVSGPGVSGAAEFTVVGTGRHNGKPQLPLPDDGHLVAALQRAQLQGLLERVAGDLDCQADWAAMLSLGEQQRLAFARLLLARPDLVLMDESTSALDTENESRLYQALRDQGITYVSVGHRPTLVRYHEEVLQLHGGGAWTLHAASEAKLDLLGAF